MNRFRKLSCLSEGEYGSVHVAANNNSLGSSLTTVKSSYTTSSASVLSLWREKIFMDELVGCPFIIQCFGDDLSIEKGQTTYNMMMEYAPGGTLKGLMKEKEEGRIQESETACYAAMLILGLSAAHSKGIVHCDLKPDNILVFPMEQKDGVLNNVVKISDFCLAKRVWEKESVGSGHNSFNRGTLLYASPESVASGDHLPATDVWSLGCIVMEMLSGYPIWGYCDNTELINRVRFMELEIPEYVSDIAKDFLTRCLERDPQKRWTTAMLLEHPFIAINFEHFRGFEHMVCQKNPFGSTAQSRIRRIDTFSDFVEDSSYHRVQPCFPYHAIFQESNATEESKRSFLNVCW